MRRIKSWTVDRRANAAFCSHDCAQTHSGSAVLVMGKHINDIINLLSFVFTLQTQWNVSFSLVSVYQCIIPTAVSINILEFFMYIRNQARV